MTKPTLFPDDTGLNPVRYCHARELIDQAVLDLDRTDPAAETGALDNIQILAHLARAALDLMTEEATTKPIAQPPPTWTQISAVLGLTPNQARTLCKAHIGPPDNPTTNHN